MTASIPDNKYTSRSSELIYSDRWRRGGGEGRLRPLHQKATRHSIYRRKAAKSNMSVLSPRSAQPQSSTEDYITRAPTCTSAFSNVWRRIHPWGATSLVTTGNHKVAMVRAETAAKAQRLF